MLWKMDELVHVEQIWQDRVNLFDIETFASAAEPTGAECSLSSLYYAQYLRPNSIILTPNNSLTYYSSLSARNHSTMVLVHKLKRMEALDIEQFREPLEEEEVFVQRKAVEKPPKERKIYPRAPQRALSPPRRPLTRSQTGRVPKRRRRDSASDEQPARPTKVATPPQRPQPKKQVEKPKPVEPVREELVPPPAPESSTKPDEPINPPPGPPEHYTFLGTSQDIDPMYPQERRGPRSRAAHPIPVPNLTKKSRGRRVPTKVVAEASGDQKPTRLYMCKVEDCGKCFNRGEHLKRHVRSIHTHEKPFKCSHPACDKFFNRHDNLLQHLKVHKDLPQQTENTPPRDMPPSPSSPAQIVPTIPSQSAAIALPYAVYNSSPTGLTTNMAVSSLRTELAPTSTHESTAARPHYRRKYENESMHITYSQHVPPLLVPIAEQGRDWQT